jgi:hypothetical protein
MVPNKFDISFSTAMMNWFDHSVPMKPAIMLEMFFLGNCNNLTDDPLSDLLQCKAAIFSQQNMKKFPWTN